MQQNLFYLNRARFLKNVNKTVFIFKIKNAAKFFSKKAKIQNLEKTILMNYNLKKLNCYFLSKIQIFWFQNIIFLNEKSWKFFLKDFFKCQKSSKSDNMDPPSY